MPQALPAAALILLRYTAGHTEILMQVRHRDIAFAGGALVFPGGKLEPQDADPGLADCIDEAGHPGALTPAKVAAIRETFEESGMLLARARGSAQLLGNDRARLLAAERKRLNRGEQRFGELLQRESLRLACDTLVHFAHWVTPEFMPHRFDTQFFLAHAPELQADTHDGRESVESVWIRPGNALEAAQKGRYKLLFPTRSILHRLSEDEPPETHLRQAGATPVVTALPRLVTRAEGRFVQIPDDIGFTYCEEQID